MLDVQQSKFVEIGQIIQKMTGVGEFTLPKPTLMPDAPTIGLNGASGLCIAMIISFHWNC